MLAAGELRAEEVLRVQARVDLEPAYLAGLGVPSPLDAGTARRWALEDAAAAFAAMIYGWSFDYEIGETARRKADSFEWQPLGAIPFGDPRLRATDGKSENRVFSLWADYYLSESQERRVSVWKEGTRRRIQSSGHGPISGPEGTDERRQVKDAALKDAARAAVRSILRGDERNRPERAAGRIALDAFPVYAMRDGQWFCTAAFNIELNSLTAFPAY
jgi:hypothetical protein